MRESNVSPGHLKQIDREEDRICAAFGLPAHVPLPRLSKETLLQYHQYLSRELSFPFQALYAETTPPVHHIVRYVTVLGLSDSPRRRMYGLFCRVQIDGTIQELPLADLGLQADEPNRQLVDDYLYWLWNSL
ncbi:MAG: calcium-binding protein [Thermoguttaceae bacterium]|jgi:hypothetical protein